jgi:hypothetical protein
MNRCPICGSTNLEEKIVEKKENTLYTGLPRHYVKDGWMYYICQDCFESWKRNNYKGEFVCAFVNGQSYLFLRGNQIWIPIGKPLKEIVQFT